MISPKLRIRLLEIARSIESDKDKFVGANEGGVCGNGW